MTAPDLQQASAFLAALDPSATAWTFQTFDDIESKQKRPELVAVRHGTLEQHAAWLASMNAQGAGIFVTVNETDGKRRKSENITRVRAVFADFDRADAATPERLRADALPPSITVESSPGKWHAYWLVDGLKLDDFQPLQKQIIRQWGTDASVSDLSRVMRLPGFFHRKGEPRLVRLAEVTGQRYSAAQLTARYPAPARAVPAPRETLPASQADEASRYGACALDSACKAIAGAEEGTRNHTLNREAFSIGQLVAGGEVPEALALSSLMEAASDSGLPDHEILSTLERSFADGLKHPRAAPEPIGLSVDAIRAAFAPAGAAIGPAPAVPLLPELEPAAPYPLEALPPRMREAVEAIADHVKAPLALAGQCVIGAAAYLAQTRVNAPHVNRSEGMPCSLFLLTLADSGDRKSECRRLAFKTVDEAEGKARTQHRQACDEITSPGAGLKGKALEDFTAARPLPADPRTQYSDATFERIAGDMIRGASAASWDTDEGGQVLGGASLKADTRAATLGGLVKAFDNGAFERTRSHGNAEGSGFAYNRRLSVHLLAQAVTVDAALSDPLLRGQGFLPRFLFASPTSLAGTRFLTTGQLNRKAYADPRLQRYWARCVEISATAQAIDPETGEVKPPVLELSAEAEAVWLGFYNEVEGEQSALGAFANLRPFAGRAGELARRLAAVFACFEGLAQIDSDCMRRAVGVVRYSLAEWARYNDSEAANPERQQAAALMEWLKEKQWQSFEARKLQRDGPTSVRKSAKKRDRLLAVLVEHRQLLATDGKQFTINPLATSATSATTPAP